MSFVINGITWEVFFAPSYSPELQRSDGSVTVGTCDLSKRSIFLSDILHGAFLRKVYIHEVCHAAIFSYSIDLNIQQEEFLCDFVATYSDEIIGIVDDFFTALKRTA